MSNPGAACWVDGALAQLSGNNRVIAVMFLVGPEADEYTHEDVWRAMQALGVQVTINEVAAHRTGRCPCRKGNA